jgi:hypothetical protein
MVDCDTKLKALQTSTCDTTQSGSNITSFEHHEPLSHTCHELLHQTNED